MIFDELTRFLMAKGPKKTSAKAGALSKFSIESQGAVNERKQRFLIEPDEPAPETPTCLDPADLGDSDIARAAFARSRFRAVPIRGGGDQSLRYLVGADAFAGVLASCIIPVESATALSFAERNLLRQKILHAAVSALSELRITIDDRVIAALDSEDPVLAALEGSRKVEAEVVRFHRSQPRRARSFDD